MSWTDFTQYLDSTDSNIIYISEDGNDATGQPYNSNTVGSDPTQPSISVQPYRTFEYVWANVVRNNKKDWVLFRRGDTFILSDSGGLLTWGTRFAKTSDPSLAPVGNLIGAYGPSTDERPIIKSSNSPVMFSAFAQREDNKLWNLAVVSLDLRIDTDDQTNDVKSGTIFSLKGVSNITVEDCVLNGGNEMQSWNATDSDLVYNASNITFNRCVMQNSYDSTSHNQGMFIGGADGVTIKECVFDNNGYKQNVNKPSIWVGRASPHPEEQGAPSSKQYIEEGHGIQPKRDWFSRNIYASAYYNLSVLGNIFTRSASGQQFRSGGLIERNVFLCNSEGISNTPQANLEYLESAEYNKNLVMLSDITDSTGSNNLLGGISTLDTNFVTVDDNIGKEFYRASDGLINQGYRKYGGNPASTLYQSTQTNNIVHLKSGCNFSHIVNIPVGNTSNRIENLSGSGNQFIIEDTNKEYIETNVSEPASPGSALPYTYVWDNNHYLNATNNYFSVNNSRGSYSTWQSYGFDENSTSYSSLSNMASALGWVDNDPDFGWERNILSYMKVIDNAYVEDVNVTTDVLTSNPRASAPKVKDVLRWGTLDVYKGSGYQVGDTFKVTQNGDDILTITVTDITEKDGVTGIISRTDTTVIDPNYLQRDTTSISFAPVSVNGTGATTSRNNFFSDAIAEDWAKQYHAFSVFIPRAKLNRYGSWDSNYTADALNTYIREGYGKTSVGGGYSESIENNPTDPDASQETGESIENTQLGSIQNIQTIRHEKNHYPILSLDILGEYNNSDFLVLRKNKTTMVGMGVQDFIIKYRNTLLRNLNTSYTIPENFDLNWSYRQGPVTNPNLIAPCFLWIKPENFVANDTQDKYLSFTNSGNFVTYESDFIAPENLSANIGAKDLNNYQPIDFDGSTNYYINDEETIDNIIIDSSDDFAIGFVLRTNSINTNKRNCIISNGRLGDDGSLYVGLNEISDSRVIEIVTQASSSAASVYTNDCYKRGDPLIGIIYRIDSTIKIKVNGIEEQLNGSIIHPVDGNDPEVIVGASRNELDTIVNLLDQSFYELVFIKGTSEIAITENIIEKLEGYFAEKYQLKSTLPSNHPYFKESPRANVIGSFNIDQTPTAPSIVCDTLTATSSGSSFTSSSGTETVTVTVADSSCGWSANTPNNDWITINTSSGTGNGSFTFTISNNTSTERTGSIVVTSGSAPSVSINITQAAGQSETPWDPSQLSTITNWYDASLETGSNGSAITFSSDQSGSVNLTATAGVTLLTNWSNNLPAYDFDPTNNSTLSASSVTTLSGAADAWVFSVHDVQNSASNPFVWHYSSTSSSSTLFSIQYRSTGTIWFRVQGSLVGSTGAGSSASGKSIAGMRTAGSTLHAYQDGTELTLSDPTITSGFPTQTAALMAIGNDNSGSKVDGAVGEVVVGNGALSDGDREKIEGYLAHKWGLTANLPVSHPYKSSAPTV
jgi:hypothetical protein